MIGRTNAEIPGSDNVTTVTLTSGTSGVTITATGGGMTRTAVTDSNGQAVFKHLLMGYDWTFTDGTNSKTERIDQLSESILLGAISIHIYMQTNATLYLHKGEYPSIESPPICSANYSTAQSQYVDTGEHTLTPGAKYTVRFYYAYKAMGFSIYKNQAGVQQNAVQIESEVRADSDNTYYVFTCPADAESLWILGWDD